MVEDRIVVYQKQTCSPCREVMASLRSEGVGYDAVDYFMDPVPLPKLRELVRKLGLPLRDLVRTKEPAYRALGLAHASDEELLAALVNRPELLQRPILEWGERAVLARPAERARNIFLQSKSLRGKA